MKRHYTVSQDKVSGLWYAHMIGFAYIPVLRSFSEKKSEAMEYAKMYDNMDHKVKQIEERKKAEFEKWRNSPF